MKKVTTVCGLGFYVTPTGLKAKAKDRVKQAGSVYAGLSKSQARRLRKALYRLGEYKKAAEKRG